MDETAKLSPKRRLVPRVGITTRFLGVFLALTLVSLVSIGAISVYSMTRVVRFAEDSSLQLGQLAADDSAAALTALGETALKQKASDVAGQVRIYLSGRPGISTKDVASDAALHDIAIQPVGRTGYTLLYERPSAIMIFHVNQELVGYDMRNWADKLPAFWKIFESAMNSGTASGYYDWQDSDGKIRDKYMYIAPVAGTSYLVAATTYIDEFLKPSTDIQGRISSAALATSRYIEQQKNTMQNTFTAAIIGMLAVITGLAFLLARAVSRPILALTAGSQAIRQGNLDYRVNVTTGDEIEELAGQFNAMASTLKESYTTLEQKVQERTGAERRRVEQLHAINEVGRKISSIMSLEELLPYIVSSVQETFKYYSVNILLMDNGEPLLKATASSDHKPRPDLPQKVTGGLAHSVAQTGKPLRVNDVARESRYQAAEGMPETRSELAVPIRLGAEILGILDIHSQQLNAFDELDLFTAETLADEVAIAIGNARLYQSAREAAVLEERNRMAREIHDTLAQGFTGIVLQLEAAEQALDSNIDEAKQHLDRARRLARESLKEARRSVWALRPQVLEQQPLVDTITRGLAQFTRSSGVKATFDISGDKRPLAPDIEDALVRICQEALTNISKHARATEVRVNLDYGADAVRLSIQDNGVGFTPQSQPQGGFGLISMRERVHLLGGNLEIQSEPGKGTVLKVAIPARKG